MPDWKTEIRARLASLNLEPAKEAGIVEGISQHLEDRFTELRERGATNDEARRAVMEELSVGKFLEMEPRPSRRAEPAVLGERKGNIVEEFFADLRYGARMLRKNPGFTAIAVLTLALGAQRSRLFRQFLTQGATLAVLGGTAGLLLAFWGVRMLPQMFASQLGNLSLPDRALDWIDWPVLLFTLSVTAAVGVAFGLAPALRGPVHPHEALKSGGHDLMGPRLSSRLRNSLIVCQVALSLILLIGSGLLARSFARLQRETFGFRTEHVLTSLLVLPPNRYSDLNGSSAFIQRVIERLQQLPGIESAGAINTLPLSGHDARRPFKVVGEPQSSSTQNTAQFRVVTPDYFRAMGISLKKGRFFDERDRQNSVGVVIINEKLARRLWPNEDPVGKSILVPDLAAFETREVVGVIGDVRHYGLAADAPVEIYRPAPQTYWPFFSLAVRTTANPMALRNTLLQAVSDVDKEQLIDDIRALDDFAADTVALRRTSMVLVGTFASLSSFLAALGIYSVMSYTVAQRTREIGLRSALGAQRHDILKMVMGNALRLTVPGLALGLIGAVLLTRFLGTLLYNVRPTDPATFFTVGALLTAVAMLASWLPARRATKVDPMAALRNE